MYTLLYIPLIDAHKSEYIYNFINVGYQKTLKISSKIKCHTTQKIAEKYRFAVYTYRSCRMLPRHSPVVTAESHYLKTLVTLRAYAIDSNLDHERIHGSPSQWTIRRTYKIAEIAVYYIIVHIVAYRRIFDWCMWIKNTFVNVSTSLYTNKHRLFARRVIIICTLYRKLAAVKLSTKCIVIL